MKNTLLYTSFCLLAGSAIFCVADKMDKALYFALLAIFMAIMYKKEQ